MHSKTLDRLQCFKMGLVAFVVVHSMFLESHRVLLRVL